MANVYGSVFGTGGGGGGGTFPAEGNVRSGIVYGELDELTGSAVDIAQPLADLDDANLSAFEDAALQSLVSMYDRDGVAADWTQDGTTTRISFLIDSKHQSLEDREGHRTELEILRGSALASVMLSPQIGDRLTMLAANGTRTYLLSKQPVMADSHLEWDLEFQRSTKVKLGGQSSGPLR